MSRHTAGRPLCPIPQIAVLLRAGSWCALLVLIFHLPGCARLRRSAEDLRGEQEQLTHDARRAQDQGDLSQAEALYTRAVNANPDNCDTRLELSALLMQHGGLESATRHLRRVVEQNPDDPRGYVRLAQALSMQHQEQEAGQLLQTALEIDPANPEGLVQYGQWLERRGQTADALETYYRAIPQLSNPAEAELRIASIKLRDGRDPQAAALLRGVIDNSHVSPCIKCEAYWLLGQAYGHEGRWKDAALAMESSLKLKKPTPEEWRAVASAHSKSGDWEAAIQCTELAAGPARLASFQTQGGHAGPFNRPPRVPFAGDTHRVNRPSNAADSNGEEVLPIFKE